MNPLFMLIPHIKHLLGSLSLIQSYSPYEIFFDFRKRDKYPRKAKE